MGRKPISPVDPNNLTPKEKQRLATKKYRDANRNEILAKQKAYRKNHLGYFKAKKQEEVERLRNDPEYRAAQYENHKKSYKKHRDKRIAKAKQYYLDNYDKLKEQRKLNSKERVATARKWQIENAERYKATQAEWRKNNMHIIRKHIALRRARLMSATIGDPNKIAAWEKEWKSKPTNTCEWCRMEFPTSECQADHAEPLIKGGPHNLDNLVVACRYCNSRKRGKSLSDWLDYLERS